MHHQIFDRFYPRARALRQTFDDRFRDPLNAHGERFQWDYWHVPGEYTSLRTPAYNYFPQRLYDHFHNHLVNWGRTRLGCHDVSPPWLSCYIEGCRQEPHQDVPHGPLAFVFSLTNWQSRKFKGGETFIVKPPLRIAPEFNRLTIFNPSLVHGVRKVSGTNDPRFGRLVIHGWFVNPRPFWTGALKLKDVEDALNNQLPEKIQTQWQLGGGLLSMRLKISANGRPQNLKILANTLSGARERDLHKFFEVLKTLEFPRYRGVSELTVPLIITP